MKKVKTSPKGRKCKFPHCKHVLSIYNHQPYCYTHLSQVDRISATKAFKS